MVHFKKIIGKKVFLSPLNQEDCDLYTKWMNDEFVAKYYGMYKEVWTLERMKEDLSRKTSDQEYAIIKEKDNEIVGAIKLYEMQSTNRRCSISLFIGEEKERHKGYGTEALQLLINYAFKQLNMYNIMLAVFAFNENAIECYKKIGFEMIGIRKKCYFIDGEFHDMFYMQITPETFKS